MRNLFTDGGSSFALSPRSMRKVWRPALDAHLCHQILDTITCIAHRLSDVDAVLQCVQEQEEIFWMDTSLTAGFPSLALFFLFFFHSTQDERWLDSAHRYLELAAQATHMHVLSTPGLSRGMCGFATVLAFFARENDQYLSARKRLDTQIARHVLARAWKKPDHDAEVFNYDVIVGISGIVRYLVLDPTPDLVVQDAIALLLELLIQFATCPESERPTIWSLPASLLPSQRRWPCQSRVINCGLAHGLPGPLAALSLALLSGYQLERQPEARHRMASWLADHHLQTAWGIDWPDVIPTCASLEETMHLSPARSGWCYGAPGLVRSLWLTGQALQDQSWQQLALEGMLAVIRRPMETRRIDPLTLCHGTAGLLLICLRFFHETDDALLQEHLPVLVHQILHEFHPACPFGFQYEFLPGQIVHSLGFLIGVSGTLLALLAACTPVEPQWDCCLLLS